jgi:TetR/AcrR family transcriptional regulator, cholesterol catabolism regulator
MEIKERIIEEALESFKLYGIRAVTMDSLARQLGISKRTIYEHFSDKDDLLKSVLAKIGRQHKALVTKVMEESENSIFAIFRLLEINSEFFQNLSPAFVADMKKLHIDRVMNENGETELPDFREHFGIVENGMRDGLFRKDINAEVANRCLFYLGKSVMDSNLYPYSMFSRSDVLKNVFINYLRGLSTSKGLELIEKLEAKI